MSHVATVVEVTPVTGRDPHDVVVLSFQGKSYIWKSATGQYHVNQQVPVNLPAQPGAHVTSESFSKLFLL